LFGNTSPNYDCYDPTPTNVLVANEAVLGWTQTFNLNQTKHWGGFAFLFTNPPFPSIKKNFPLFCFLTTKAFFCLSYFFSLSSFVLSFFFSSSTNIIFSSIVVVFSSFLNFYFLICFCLCYRFFFLSFFCFVFVITLVFIFLYCYKSFIISFLFYFPSPSSSIFFFFNTSLHLLPLLLHHH
jgi:hypothetical protein